MSDAAVIVLGGGPAGSAAAITAAMLGVPVTLIERDEFPRHAPGESLHPGVQPLLRQLGVEDSVLAAGFLRYPGHRVRWAGEEEFQPFGSDAAGPWLGFQAWRPTFDALLLERAKSLGVVVRQPCSVSGMLTSGDRVVGIETATGPIPADIVIDATGRWRALSRWLSLEWQRLGPTRLAWYGYATGPEAERIEVPLLCADATGWTWVARVRTDTFAWARLSFNNARPPANWLPDELIGTIPDCPIRGADVTWQIANRPAGPGYFLTGDAVATLDPASSHGVLKALMSGIHAGHLAGHVLHGSISAEMAASKYSLCVREWFDKDVARLNELYTRLPGPAATVTAGQVPLGGISPALLED